MSENNQEKPPPTAIQTYNYAANLYKEMEQLAKSIGNRKNQRLVFQTLPKHMRRRAMSHHPNRLPRNRRAAHIAQMSKTAPPVINKRPSRLYRRRPRRLMADYVRRMRRQTWLETHLWHARRFKMVERWGYKLPYCSTEKTYRACYSASKDYCLLQDVSFMCCLELHGKLDKLLQGFVRLTSDKCGAGLGSRTFLNGHREGSVHLFRDQQYPHSAIANVQFMWRPVADEKDDKRTLWLWVHPSVSHVLLEELVTVFALKNQKTIKVPLNEEELKDVSKEAKQQELIYKTVTKLSNFEEIIYQNAEQDVTLTNLKNKFNRFRLTGPKSFALLKSIFQSEAVNLSHENAQCFWHSLCTDNTALQGLLPNTIISLSLKNAMLSRSGNILNFTDNSQASYDVKNVFVQCTAARPYLPSGSGLWSRTTREQFTRSFIKAQRMQTLSKKRSAIPGKQLNYLNENLQPMPVLLVQRMGTQCAHYSRLSYGAGWDVILPNGAGMPMWLALVMRGARVGALRETLTICREMGVEEQLPDTLVGKCFAAEEERKQEQKYFSLPTNKRVSYCAIGMRYPFRAPFEQLIKDWQGEGEFHVLRDSEQLLMIKWCLTAAQEKQKNINLKLAENINRSALVQVRVLLNKRGAISNNSLICLPSLEQNNKKYVNLDRNKAERLLLRKEHKMLIKRMRARRVRQKRKLQETSETRVKIAPAGTEELCLKHAEKMRNLFLPSSSYDDSRPVAKLFADTQVLGFVTTSQFSYTEGHFAGVGYIALNALQELIYRISKMEDRQMDVILRDKDTAVDRPAIIKIALFH